MALRTLVPFGHKNIAKLKLPPFPSCALCRKPLSKKHKQWITRLKLSRRKLTSKSAVLKIGWVCYHCGAETDVEFGINALGIKQWLAIMKEFEIYAH